MKIYHYQEKKEFVKEYFELCMKEWGNYHQDTNTYRKIENKTEKLLAGENIKIISALFLIDNDELIGFISLFWEDADERKGLYPWYSTMYVKKEYRGKGYSKILNDAILLEAKNLGYHQVYLKTTLENYYEKFGAKLLDNLATGEKLYVLKVK